LIAPLNLTENPQIREANKANKEFLIKNIDEYLEKLRPKGIPG
jgi:hypothetical protein